MPAVQIPHLTGRRILCLAVAAVFSVSCGGKGGDSGLDLQESCGGGGSPGLVIGFGSGGAFEAYSEGTQVGLAPAPQGGFGVWVRARTEGLKAIQPDGTPHATSEVLLETYIEGERTGSFLNDTVEVYCQDDGSGLLWDVAVGFDPVEYSTNEELIALEGQDVMLLVRATDEDGNEVQGTVDVVIALGL